VAFAIGQSGHLIPLCPSLQKGEKNTIDLADRGAGHEGKNYKIS
jgi:hypothetical protein